MPVDEPSGGELPDKALSNPASTGGAGPQFEVQVMSAFAVLMLAGGVAPCLDCSPIRQIRLQDRKAGYRIDDFVVHAADANYTTDRKLLVQVKLGINFTASDKDFREAVIAAWRDFNEPSLFNRQQDAIAIATGPLSATDMDGVRKILDWARTRASARDFFTDMERNRLTSNVMRDKLYAIRSHINAAVSPPPGDDDVFQFLRHLHILSYDLDARSGVAHALLRTIIGCFQSSNPIGIWARILEEVAAFDRTAGTLTVDNFPEDIRRAFQPRIAKQMPTSLATTIPPKEECEWNQSEYAEALTIASLLGAWDERSQADMKIVAALSPIGPEQWLGKMREVLHRSDSPLRYQNGVWTVRQRAKLWASLESRIFGPILVTFRTCAMTVLGEIDPKFELEPDRRFAAAIYGKVLAHSAPLRAGIAETLALLGTNAATLTNCEIGTGEGTATVVVRELLERADWKVWGSLDRLLPTLAEASPDAFMAAIEGALSQKPTPFDMLFAQRGDAIFGGFYLCGLLWALETLAWEESSLVRVAVILAILATHEPGGNSGNTPSDSLTRIFLPWFPQTRASVEKRVVAVKAVVSESPEVGWKLLKSLLPSHHGVSMPTSKPKWRNKLDDDGVPKPTVEEYWKQTTSYAEMAIEIARADLNKLAELVESLDTLPKSALDDLLSHLESPKVIGLSDEVRLPIWTKLTAVARKHRQFADAKWALPPELLNRIEQAASQIAPKDPFVAHRILFTSNPWDLYDDRGDWQANEKKLRKRQRNAITEIYEIGGFEVVGTFAASVENQWKVGYILGQLESIDVVSKILPQQMNAPAPSWRSLAEGFVAGLWGRCQWTWFDSLNMSGWTTEQIAQLLIHLPFGPETWTRVDQRLGANSAEYWREYPVAKLIRGDQDYVAVDAFMEVNRPGAAVACLAALVLDNQPIDPARAVNALLAVQSREEFKTLDPHCTVSVIKALQDNPATDKDKLIAVEWSYLAWLKDSHVTQAKTLSASIAKNPDSFCQLIRTIFRSDNERDDKERPEPTEERRALAENAYRLLQSWNIVPGTLPDGSISADALDQWIDAVRASLMESGHLDVGLQKAGEVFLHAPADPSGLFIHRAVAKVLNREDMGELRHGYDVAIFNSRGGHFVDPTGAPEKNLARVYKEKADAVENAGFHRLASTYRSIAKTYEREAERIIANHRAEGQTPDCD